MSEPMSNKPRAEVGAGNLAGSSAWQIPTDRLLRVRFGRNQIFEVVARCIKQNAAGVLLAVNPETDSYAGFKPEQQFVPYESLLEVLVLTALSKESEKLRIVAAQEKVRKVREELEGMVGSRQYETPPPGLYKTTQIPQVEAPAPAPAPAPGRESTADRLRRLSRTQRRERGDGDGKDGKSRKDKGSKEREGR